jgi:hypothetical protein
VIKRKLPNTKQIELTLPFAIQLIFDPITKLWLASNFQGPLFLLRMEDDSLSVLIMSQKKQDFIVIEQGEIEGASQKGSQYLHMRVRRGEHTQRISIWTLKGI